jgi:hypothetical protein
VVLFQRGRLGFDRDESQIPPRARKFWGEISMNSIRPDTTDPLPLRTSPHGVGTLMLRFVGLLFVAVTFMALVWNR